MAQQQSQTAPQPRSAPADHPAASKELSDADRAAQLEQTIEADRKRLTELEDNFKKREDEYQKSWEAFKGIDKQYKQSEEQLLELRKAGKQEEAGELLSTIAEVEKKRQLAKERFDLAIQARKTIQNQMTALEAKAKQDQQALTKLLGTPEAESGNDAPGETPQDEGHSKAASTVEGPSEQAVPPTAADQQNSQPADKPGEDEAVPKLDALPREEVLKAQQQAEEKRRLAEEAKRDLGDVIQTIELLDKAIEGERQTLEMARRNRDNASRLLGTLESELKAKRGEQAAPEQIEEVQTQIGEQRQRLREAESEIQNSTDELNRLQTDRAAKQDLRIVALEQAKAKEQEAEQAEKAAAWYASVLNPQNIVTWLQTHWNDIFGVVLIVVGMFVLRRVVRLADRRLVALVARTATRGEQEDRDNRAKTLVGVFHNVSSIAIVIGGFLMIVATINSDWIAPLVGALAVVGIAVGLGTQGLVRDYFHGFVLLLENQYTVNDVVKIGDTAGLVERITLRMTVLRDLEGTAHFVPHGQISSVSNMTHEWSRAVLAVGVAYKEDVDRVMDVLMQLGRELREDPQFRGMILEGPEMLGVDAFGESEVVVKFFLKTKPLKQWAVKRELQRRIKNRFDELGIEIPFPHRTVIHHHENGTAHKGPISRQVEGVHGVHP